MIKIHQQLGFKALLLATTDLRSPKSPIEKKITTVLQVCISILLSVFERTSCCGVSNRREPIHFETGDERKDTKNIRWVKVQAVEGINNEGKDRTATVEVLNHKKSRGVPQLHAPPHIPLLQPRLCYPMLS